jgi:hypothetical protein
MTSKRTEIGEYGISRISYTNGFGQFHREDGPAEICGDGTEYWYQNGKLFREDGPCIIYPDGSVIWPHQSDGSCFMENERGDEVWRSKEKLP